LLCWKFENGGLPRELFGLGNDSVRGHVWITGPLSSFLSFWPAAEFRVALGSAGLCFRLRAAKQRANVNFLVAMWAFKHAHKLPNC